MSARAPAVAPLRDDALIRAKTIAFEETRVKADAGDEITPRMLADNYLQRYRESGDVGDILRARAMAQRSIAIAPQTNTAARMSLASALLALHRFAEAREIVRAARRGVSAQPGLGLMEASLDLEIGDLAGARALVAKDGGGDDGAAVTARLDELTGDVSRARTLLGAAAARADAVYGMPNERRAWFHVRLGELAFAAGDFDTAFGEERTALDRFPNDVQAFTDTARFAAAAGHWADARTAAERAVALVPSPENLGFLADAQVRSGHASDASATRDEIGVVERLGNSQRLVDRLLAIYYADHGINGDDAYAIALRDRELRDDPFTEDAIAWTAARSGRWPEARVATRRATAWNTADARIWYHAAVISDHDHDRAVAIRDYDKALALNPHFEDGFADDARARVAALRAN